MTTAVALASTLVRPGAFWTEWKAAFQLLLGGGGLDYTGAHTAFVQTAEHTFRLAVYATGIAALVGLPLGCAMGIGRFPGRGALLAIGNALTRVPPVVVGVVVILLLGGQTEFGVTSLVPPVGFGRVYGGPLYGVSWAYDQRDILAQTLLAVPIMIALSATAVQRVPRGLLDQAEAYGAPGWKRGLLALREARIAIFAAVIVAMGVTITAVGALYVVDGGLSSGNGGSDSLALSALENWQHPGMVRGGADAGTLAVAYTEVLIGIFVVMAAGLTFLQQNRTSWIAGGQS